MTLAPRYRGALKRIGRRIRRRLLWAFIAFGMGAASTWYFREDIFRLLLEPAGGSLSPFDGLPVFTAPTEMMGATIHLALRGGAIAAMPVIAIGLFTLISPALPYSQKRFLAIFLPASALSFVAGALFAYFVLLPAGLNFLLNFGEGVAVPLITITEYMELFTAMVFWLGIVFQLPLAMYLLASTRIVRYRKMRNLRKFVPVSAFILSAIITPTFDVINQTLLAVPIIVLYEFGLLLAWLAHPDEEDYLFVKKIRNGILWLWHLPCRVYWKLVGRPLGRLWRLVRRK